MSTEWNFKRLAGDIKIKHGFAFKGEFFSGAGKYILITPGNFYEVGGFKYTPGKEKFYLGDYPSEYLCKKGDLVVAMTEQAAGLLGSTALVPENDKFLHNQRIGLIDFDEEQYDKIFLYYLFRTKTVRAQIAGSASGTKVKHTSPERIYDVLIKKPPLHDQKLIGEVLKSIDAKIEVNNKINAELEAMAKLIYDYWFVQFDFPFDFAQGKPDANGQPYKSSGGKMVYNEQLKREIPEGWGVKELGDFVNIYDSKRVPISKGKRSEILGKYPYYGATGIMDYVNDFIFDDDYILVAEDGSVMDENGFCIVQFIWGKTWVNNHAHVLQARNILHNEYLFQFAKRIAAVKITTGSIQLKINQENLKSVPTLIPPDSILNSYCEVANSIRKKLINNQEENQKLSELRDWLLPMLMNGQVTVKEAEQYVADTEVRMAAEDDNAYGK